jgi:hypothetical protein
MPAPKSGAPPAPSLYDLLAARLPPHIMARCGALFDAFSLGGPLVPTFRVGPIVREAWEAERAVDKAIADDVADLLQAIIEGAALGAYAPPGCCNYHGELMDLYFGPTVTRPPDHKMLEAMLQVVWAILPHVRGVVSLDATPPKTFAMSRFMPLESFLSRHEASVVRDGRRLPGAMARYALAFGAKELRALRKAELNNRLKAGDLLGMIGARPERDPVVVASPHYCVENRPFATPNVSFATLDRLTGPPDDVLRTLGLQFDKDAPIVELIYEVNVAVTPPSCPTVLDAAGYWLFRPDRRSPRAGQFRWNYTRDVATNGRGLREFVAPAIPIGSLNDLVVWQLPAATDWNTGAALCLSDDLAIH